jgi:hypothetical protein
MTWLEFYTAVYALMPSDARRLNVGVSSTTDEPWLRRLIRQAVGDLQRYVPAYTVGHESIFTPDDLSIEGSAHIGSIPATEMSAAIRMMYSVREGHTCCRRPYQPYPGGWANRFDLTCANAMSASQGQVVIDPYGKTFMISPIIEDGFELDVWWDGIKIDFLDAETVPFDEQAANAVALYCKAHIEREVKQSTDGFLLFMGKPGTPEVGTYYYERQQLFLSHNRTTKLVEVAQAQQRTSACSACACNLEPVLETESETNVESMKLLPKPNARIIVVGNTNLLTSGITTIMSAIVNLIDDLDADLVVLAGDIVDQNTNYLNTLNHYYPDEPYGVPGNNDLRAGVLGTYSAAFSWLPVNGVTANRHSWYKSIGDTARIYGLNSNAGQGEDITDIGDQAVWIRGLSAAATEPWQFAIMHDSPFSNDAVNGDKPILQWGHGPGEPLEYMAAVLSGNSSHYERLLKGAKTYIVAGSGSPTLAGFAGTTDSMAQLEENGIVVIDTNWGECTMRFVNLNGSIRDQLTLTR